MVKLDLKALQNKENIYTGETEKPVEDIIDESKNNQNEMLPDTLLVKGKIEKQEDLPIISPNKKVSLASLIGSGDSLPKSLTNDDSKLKNEIKQETEIKEEPIIMDEIKSIQLPKISIGINKNNLDITNNDEDKEKVSEKEILPKNEEISSIQVKDTVTNEKQEVILSIENPTEKKEIFSTITKIDNIDIEDEKEFFPNFDIAQEFSFSDDDFVGSETNGRKIKELEDKSVKYENPGIEYVENVKSLLSINRKTIGLTVLKKRIVIPIIIVISFGMFGIIGNSLYNGKSNIIESNKLEDTSSGKVFNEGLDFKEGTDFKILKNTKKNIKKSFSGQQIK